MADPEHTYRINSSFLRSRINTMGLKRVYVAEAAQVNLSTLRRWVNGSVKRITFSNLVALASVLKCDTQDLVIPEDGPEEVIRDQISAAGKLAKTFYAKDLFRSGKLVFSAQLLKSFFISGLPRDRLGILYCSYAFLQLMQSNFSASRKYCENVLSWQGDAASMESKNWAKCILGLQNIYEAKFIDAEIYFRSAVDNDQFKYCQLISQVGLATSLIYQGRYSESKLIFTRAVPALLQRKSLKKKLIGVMGYFNWIYAMMACTEYDEAREKLDIAERVLAEISYDRGKKMVGLLRSWLMAVEGNVAAADNLCLDCLRGYPPRDPGFIHFEIAAKVFRTTGNMVEMRRLLNTILQKENSACRYAGFFGELAVCTIENGSTEFQAYADCAIEGLMQSGAPLRAKELQLRLIVTSVRS